MKKKILQKKKYTYMYVNQANIFAPWQRDWIPQKAHIQSIQLGLNPSLAQIRSIRARIGSLFSSLHMDPFHWSVIGSIVHSLLHVKLAHHEWIWVLTLQYMWEREDDKIVINPVNLFKSAHQWRDYYPGTSRISLLYLPLKTWRTNK